MLNNLLLSVWDQSHLYALYAFVAFLATAVLLAVPFPFLPHDQGRPYAVNGEKSKGKVRGVGLVMILVFLVCAFLFIPFQLEFLLYAVILLIEMLSGYLDDASKIPWSDYKKGLIDLILSVAVGVIFVLNNPSEISFGATTVSLHPVLYGILATVLVWMSVNAVNCTDGVDGLSNSVGFVSLLSFLLIYSASIPSSYKGYILLFLGVMCAYLVFNASPSAVLMGDAGSRALGVFLAIVAMKSGHPVAFLLLCGVFVLDGLTGLVKVFLKRFFKICILTKTRTPLHDEMRKNRGWSDTQVVTRFAIAQIVLSLIWYLTTL